jgi:peptidyl-prolyl cis-trans isomerase B (cyclophilin B)
MRQLLISLAFLYLHTGCVLADDPARSPIKRSLSGSIVDASDPESDSAPQKISSNRELNDVAVTIKTARGDIDCIIYASKVPMTAANFLNLAKRGYYDNLKFHRVIPNFMIQGGDPKGTGSGGPGYSFSDETRRDLLHDGPGVLSMANSDQVKEAFSNRGKTNGSQFFITHTKTDWLDGKHTVFGRVTKGQDVVDAIKQNDKILAVEIKGDVDPLFEAVKDQLAAWNQILDQNKK